MSTDILISFDVTGSMSSVQKEVRRRIDETFEILFGRIPDLRMAIVSHGDYCDPIREQYNQIDFTDNIPALKHFVNETPNTGGGDADEFYELVLSKSRFLNWRADGNKLMMVIGDCNPHPVGYRYGNVTYTVDWIEEAKKLAELGVQIYPIQALGNRSADKFYKGLAQLTGGKRVELNQFLDSVETIIAVSLHKAGVVEEYKQELIDGFKMNRNLANLFGVLQGESFDYKIEADRSGLIPVPPARFQILFVEANCDIKSFVESKGVTFRKGRGFYQFMKSETVQEHKEVVLRNKLSGDLFTGAEARNFIGLPFGVRGKIKPKLFDDYEVYIQSTSANRKLIGGYKFLYENPYY